MRTQIAVSQRYLYICKHISRLFSGSHLTAKLGSCCPVFFLTFYAPFQDGKSLICYTYYTIIKARSPLDCVNRIDHFFKLIALNLNTLPFNITQFAVGFSSTNFRSLFSPMRKYFAASSMVRVYFSQIGTSV